MEFGRLRAAESIVRNLRQREIALGHDDILQIVFTSGTTADPKGVVITHGNVLANIAPLEREMQRYLKYERWVHPLRFLNLLPLSHVFGQFLGMFLPPLLGATVIFQNELKPSEIIGTIQRERVSVLVSVPRRAAIVEAEDGARNGRPEQHRILSQKIRGFESRSIFCGAGGRFARFAASLGGNSGR